MLLINCSEYPLDPEGASSLNFVRNNNVVLFENIITQECHNLSYLEEESLYFTGEQTNFRIVQNCPHINGFYSVSS